MRIRIERAPELESDEIVIRCREPDDRVEKICGELRAALDGEMEVEKDGSRYYIVLSEVLFFETSGSGVFAHTADSAYAVKKRLYELEDFLPGCFMRISKSAIINTDNIYSIEKRPAPPVLVGFANTHKQLYVSRRYYKTLRERLAQRKGY